MKTKVFYYSGKGSNKYLAEKTAEALGCEAVKLSPRAAALVMPATALGFSFGLKPVNKDMEELDRVVLCGPLYMGRIAAPCKDFIKKYGKQIKVLDVISCCGSTDEKKDEKFGYGQIFSKVKEQVGNTAGIFTAFPIELLLGEDQRGDDQAMMNTRMNDQTFNEKVEERLNKFVNAVTSD